MCDLTALTDIALLIKHESLRDRCAQQLNIFLAISVTKMLDQNSVTIGSSVTYIGYKAFENCASLSNVTFKNANGWWHSYSVWYGTEWESIPADDLTFGRGGWYLRDKYCDARWKRD